jgi:hypothetical protein
MELREYLEKIHKEHGSTRSHICKKFGLTEVTMRKVLRGYGLSLGTMKKIVDATDGAVDYMDLINVYLRNLRPTQRKDSASPLQKE